MQEIKMSAKSPKGHLGGSAPTLAKRALGGKKIIMILSAALLLAAACQKIELKKEIPSSPKESYEQLPK
jgi:hypothetical protein